MKIIIFLQYYHTPDCPTAARPYALVERLARNHDVSVITTRAWEENRLAHRFPWTPKGVDLIRLDVPYQNSMSSVERLRSFVDYAVRAIGYGLQMPRPDLIFGSSTPLTAAAAAAAVASFRDIPWIFEVRDLWPDFPIQMGAIPWSFAQKLLYGLEASLYRSASHVVPLSSDMEQHVRTYAPNANTTTIEYGSDPQLIDDISADQQSTLRNRFGLDRRFTVLYAGSFGRANAIPTLLDTAKQFSDQSDVLFAFAGRGYHAPTVQRATRRYDHIRNLPPLPYPDALTLFSIADVSLVSFLDRPVLATNSPQKFYDSLATGTPVVVTNPGWTKRFVQTHNCGWYVPPESPDALSSCLRTVLETPSRLNTASQNARNVGRRLFDRSELMDRYTRLIEHVGGNANR